jgi:GNAT superfamily N-acetyltransferase
MDQAKSLIQSNPNPKWSTDASFDNICTAVSRSFAGSETAAAEPICSWVFRDVLPKEGASGRVEGFKFLMTFAIDEVLRKGGIAFGHPDDKSDGLQSCAIIREFDPAIEFEGSHRWDDFVTEFMGVYFYLRAKIGGTLPVVFIEDNKTAMKTLEEQGQLFIRDLKEGHKLYGPKGKHIYIFNLATDPDFQGRGYGKQMMTQINDISDASGLPCYLECSGEKNRSFYEKFGYKTVKQHPLADRKNEEILLEYMVRQPKV